LVLNYTETEESRGFVAFCTSFLFFVFSFFQSVFEKIGRKKT
jgi:hypothetical protein